MSKTRAAVVIVGGGPVGLLTALRLGQAGIDTLVLEAHDSILPATRAVVYMPVVIPVLKKLGILEAVKHEAFLNRQGITWRDIEGRPLANLPLTDDTSGEFGGVLLLGQYKLAMIILEELKKYPCVQVCFGQRCVGMQDDPAAGPIRLMTVTRSIEQPELFVEADYVLATDGANSAVRRLLCIPFEGFSYREWKMIGTDVLFDFVDEQDFTPLNFIVHPEHWAVIAYTGQDERGNRHGSGGRPQYRVAYVEKPDLPDAPEDYLRRAHERLPVWIKGGKPFELLRAEPYINSQRVAREAIKGRVLIGGDALHSNNPIGGLGLTSGIADAYCFGNALVRVVQGKESASLLKECADARRQTWIDATNPLSQANVNRLYATDKETVAAREGFFGKLNTDSAFPALVRAAMGKILVDTFEV